MMEIKSGYACTGTKYLLSKYQIVFVGITAVQWIASHRRCISLNIFYHENDTIYASI